MKLKSKLIVLAAILASAHLPVLAQDSLQKSPEAATGYAEKAGWAARKYMVAAANPLAVEAGYEMLKQGGTAIDAGIATQLVLTLVEPQSSGIGGGAFLMYYGGKKGQAFDGREADLSQQAQSAIVAHSEGPALPSAALARIANFERDQFSSLRARFARD